MPANEQLVVSIRRLFASMARVLITVGVRVLELRAGGWRLAAGLARVGGQRADGVSQFGQCVSTAKVTRRSAGAGRRSSRPARASRSARLVAPAVVKLSVVVSWFIGAECPGVVSRNHSTWNEDGASPVSVPGHPSGAHPVATGHLPAARAPRPVLGADVQARSSARVSATPGPGRSRRVSPPAPDRRPLSRVDRGRARDGADDLPRRVRPHGTDRPAFNNRAGRGCRSKPGACAA
jgi:hypothetical protein